MIASKFMVAQPQTCRLDEQAGEVFKRMRSLGLRLMPAIDAGGTVKGVLSTLSLLGHIVPDYIVSGDLDAISYAPDFGLLRKHYDIVSNWMVADIIDTQYLSVGPNESLLSVAAALIGSGRHEYALVVETDGGLLGIISAGDILGLLAQMANDRQNDV